MASLTDTLNSERRGEETITSGPVAPSFLESAARAGSMFVNAVEQGNAVSLRRESNRRAREDQARQNAEYDYNLGKRGAENDAAKGWLNTFVGSDDLAAQANSAANDAAGGLVAQQEASAQGRGVTPQTVELRAQATIRSLLARHPGYEAVVLETLKQQGVTTAATFEYDRAKKAVEADDAAAQQREKAIDDKILELGIDPDKIKGQPVAYERARATAIQIINSDYMLEQAQKRLAMQQTQQNMSITDRKETEEINGKQVTSGLVDQIGGRFQGFVQQLTLYANDSSVPEAERIKNIQTLVGQAEQLGNLQYNALIGKYGASLRPEDLSRVKGVFDSYMGSLKNLVSGDASLVVQNQRQLQYFTDKLKLDNQTALPIWSRLKEAVGPAAVQSIINSGILDRPEYRGAFEKELPHLIADTNTARVATNNLIQMIQGNLKIRDLNSAEARTTLARGAAQVMLSAVANPDIATGKDKQGHQAAMNAIGTVDNAAIEAVPQWGARPLMNSLTAMTRRGVIQTIMSADAEDRTPAIQSHMAAMQKSYNALVKAPDRDEYFDLKWDNNRQGGAGWVVARNKTPARVQPGTSVARFGYLPGFGEPQAPKWLYDKAAVMNNFVATQSQLGRDGHDGTPLSQATDQERRNWYGRSQMPQSVRDAQKTEAGKKPKPPSIDDLKSDIIGMIGAESYTPGATGSARGVRNNNEGNLRASSFTQAQPGFVGTDDKGFAQFDTPENGRAAQEKLLVGSYINKGHNTIDKIINRYAPAGENSAESMANYKAYVAKKLNININDTITPALAARLAQAMREFENGQTG